MEPDTSSTASCNLESLDSQFTWCWKLGTSVVGFSNNLESLDSKFTWCWKLGTSVVGLGLGSLLSPVPGPSIARFKSCPKNRTIDSACKLELDEEPGTSLPLELDPDPASKPILYRFQLFNVFLITYFFLFLVGFNGFLIREKVSRFTVLFLSNKFGAGGEVEDHF
jgi:hypothetical protein